MAKKDETLIIYRRIIDLIYYSKNLLNKYPKSERFDLCSDIKNSLYYVLEEVMYAIKEKEERLKHLRNADVKLYLLKALIRISSNYKYINVNNFMTWDSKVDEIGKMIGSWIKKCQNE